MTRYILIAITLSLTIAACNKNASPTQPPATDTNGSEAPAAAASTDEAGAVAATQPDHDKLVTHIEGHIEYPADRDKVLKACADTDEFSESEKLWVANNLAEGEYADAAAVISALGL
jgi:hypothetical protein